MRKIIVLLALLCQVAVQAQTEKQVVIYRNGRLPLRVNISQVDSIRFELPEDPYEAVDLGLSVEWAACNLGATAPEEYGDYFAWGETEPKETYTEENYLLAEDGHYQITLSDIALTEYDAAHVRWGYEWRMPTIEEVDELATKCVWTWTSQNGVSGYRIVGPSGKSIFLPATGQKREEGINVGSTGYYWSSTASTDYSTAAYNLNFTGYDGRWSANRTYGFTIRAVRE